MNVNHFVIHTMRQALCGGSKKECIGLEFEQQISLLIAEIVSFIIDHYERAAVVIGVGSELKRCPGRLRCIVNRAPEHPPRSLFLILLVERAYSGEKEERIG